MNRASEQHLTRQLVGAYVPDLVRDHLKTNKDFRRFYNVLVTQVRGAERAKGVKDANGFYLRSHEETLKRAVALGVDFRKTFELAFPTRFGWG